MAPADRSKINEESIAELPRASGEQNEDSSTRIGSSKRKRVGPSAFDPALRAGMMERVPPYGFGVPMMGGPSFYEMAFWNQRAVMEEQTRMRFMAQAAAMADLRAKRLRFPSDEALVAQDRLKKRRQLSELPSLRSTPNKASLASNFLSPGNGTGSTFNQEHYSLDMYQILWDKLSNAAAKVYKEDDQGKIKFVRHYFAKALETNAFQFCGEQESHTVNSGTRDNKETEEMTRSALKMVTSEVNEV